MIVDSGVLYAVLDRRDQHHRAASELVATTDAVLRVPMLVVAEVAHLAGKRLGGTRVATFNRRDFGIVSPRHCERFTLLP